MKSDNVKKGMQQAPHRSLFNALGMTEEEMVKKMMGDAKLDIDSKEFKDAQEETQKMQGLGEDPLFKKIMAEGRTLTKKEAEYFHEKYGADFEYDGMEEYNDSIGVYAQLNGQIETDEYYHV